MEKEMIKKTQDYLTAVAMGAINYSEGLGIATEDLSSKFALVLREHQEVIEVFTPQEIALFLAFSNDVNPECYDEYVNVFLNKPLLSAIIETNPDINDQIQLLYDAEGAYYESGLDNGTNSELCDFLNSISHNIRITQERVSDTNNRDSSNKKFQSR